MVLLYRRFFHKLFLFTLPRFERDCSSRGHYADTTLDQMRLPCCITRWAIGPAGTMARYVTCTEIAHPLLRVSPQ